MRNVLLWGEMQQRASVLLERADKEGEVNDARRDKKKTGGKNTLDWLRRHGLGMQWKA